MEQVNSPFSTVTEIPCVVPSLLTDNQQGRIMMMICGADAILFGMAALLLGGLKSCAGGLLFDLV